MDCPARVRLDIKIVPHVPGTSNAMLQTTNTETPVKRKPGRPRKGPPAQHQRIEADLLEKARIVCADRGIELTTYLSNLLRPHVARDFEEVLARLIGTK